ncbi:guanylate kinase [Butyrivibrio sp. MC2013]|uniref:guanylate kinase n=1 Tax=Butyrivibrio sp. MC2013 TaxID=1280686 RepID=UPI00041BCB92|nr:guanylate kinase [Butyrivibrio sp. MC2013]
MGKIIVLMGKSTTGKDTLYKKLLSDEQLGLKRVVPYTTRPMRDGEKEGMQYHFVDEEGYNDFFLGRKIIEERVYQTQYGPWRYFTADDGQIDLDKGSFLLIGTLQAFISLTKYYGEEDVIPVYIEIPDRVRIERAIRRENRQAQPKYDEMCRRYLADDKDFSEECIREAGVTKRFNNDRPIEESLAEISSYLIEKGI